ncbi:hypothetical protein EJB05_32030, partial [Eragrostis curvula]
MLGPRHCAASCLAAAPLPGSAERAAPERRGQDNAWGDDAAAAGFASGAIPCPPPLPYASAALLQLTWRRPCFVSGSGDPPAPQLPSPHKSKAAAAATTPSRSAAERPRRRSSRTEVVVMGHPYAPAELEVPGYVPLQLSQGEILVTYIGTSLFVFLAVWLISGRCRLSKTDRLLMCWWAFTGLTHILIEGPFVFTPNFFQKENPNFFDEVWKEYSKGDSRYVARDAATVTVEGITAVLEGPASLLAVYVFSSSG